MPNRRRLSELAGTRMVCHRGPFIQSFRPPSPETSRRKTEFRHSPIGARGGRCNSGKLRGCISPCGSHLIPVTKWYCTWPVRATGAWRAKTKIPQFCVCYPCPQNRERIFESTEDAVASLVGQSRCDRVIPYGRLRADPFDWAGPRPFRVAPAEGVYDLSWELTPASCYEPI